MGDHDERVGIDLHQRVERGPLLLDRQSEAADVARPPPEAAEGVESSERNQETSRQSGEKQVHTRIGMIT